MQLIIELVLYNIIETNDKKIYLRKDKMAETIGESRFLDNHYS